MSGLGRVSEKVIWAIGLGIFLVFFVLLYGPGNFGFLAGFFLAVLIALLATIVIYLCFGYADPSTRGGHGTAGSAVAQGASAPRAEPVSEPAPSPAVAAPASATSPVPEPGPAPAPEPASKTEGGVRPAGLDEPRGGAADNLKMIKGIGPKLEQLCNSMGFWHFDQVAAWSADEVAWVDGNLKGFKGRVSRDNWVKQAKILAEGGETEFSKRVEDGDVY